MKTIRKYTNLAFLLLSVATIVPAHANQEDTGSQNIETVWYKRPEIRETAESTLKIAFVIATLTCMHIVFRGYAKAKTDGALRDKNSK